MKNKLIYILVAVLIAVSAYSYISVDSYKSKLNKNRKKADSLENTTEKFKNLYESSSRKVDKIKSRNKELQNYIEDVNEKIEYQTNVIGTLSDSIKNISTKADTIYREDSSYVSVRSFNKHFNPFYISGYFEIKPPYNISFDTVSAEINLEISYSKDKSGALNTFVDTKSDNVKISDITTNYVDRDELFWNNITIGSGVYTSSTNAMLYIRTGYKNSSIMLGYGIGGFGVGFDYNIK